MAFLATLWLPILLSSVFVFIVSSLIHMVLQYHKNDFSPLPDEARIMDALRSYNIPPGDYLMPRAESMKAMKSPEFMEKMNRGPVAVMTFIPRGKYNMGKLLGLWFLFCIAVSICAAYVTDRAVGAGATYMNVFRFIAPTAFMGYALALCQDSIWYSRKWSTTILFMIDGLIYALVTAGTFGWLWPR